MPVRLMCSQPSGETCLSSSSGMLRPCWRRSVGEARGVDRFRDLPAEADVCGEALRWIEGWPAALRSHVDVQDPDPANTLHAVGRRHRVSDQGPAFLHALSWVGARGCSARRQNGLAAPRAVVYPFRQSRPSSPPRSIASACSYAPLDWCGPGPKKASRL